MEMAKHMISMALDENLLLELKRQVDNGRFRNRSHAIDFLINKALTQEKEDETNATRQPNPTR